jgi:ACT domain-containing protein
MGTLSEESNSLVRVIHERDELRAENTQLRLTLSRSDNEEMTLLRAEIARRQKALDDAVVCLADERVEVEQLRAALEKGRRLVEDMDLRMPEQATEDADGWINSYRIPVGPWHRLLGWARGG